MKKILFVLLIALFTASFVYAEQSAQTYSGNSLIKGDEQSVFIDAYNNSGVAVGSGSVVILDTAATIASGSIGSYFTSTTTAQSPLVVGIVTNNVGIGGIGRICVRGLTKANLVAPTVALNGSTSLYPAGASLATSTTSLKANTPSSTYAYGQFAVVLRGSEVAGEFANSVYYVWVGGPTT